MAAANFWNGLKNKVRTAYNNFFYDGSAAPPPPSMQDEGYSARQPSVNQWQDSAYGANIPHQQPGYQQAPAQPYFQTGAQQTYQQQDIPQQSYGQTGYQTPSAPQQRAQQTAAQSPLSRFRRSGRNSKVVDFNDYQQKSKSFDPIQPAQTETPEQSVYLMSARVINAQSMGDCRCAISLLRNGDAVLVVMESITDHAEMRRMVDTLSGACYSLTASITKVSRHGSYLLAPQTMAVFADQATIAMNNSATRAQTRPAYQSSQRPLYTSPQRDQQQPGQRPGSYQTNAYMNPQGFTQQAATPEEAPRDFYQRPMPQQAQPTGFSAQPTAYGYAPDEIPAAGQQ